MTTKGEGLRYRQERSGPKKAKRVLHQRRKTAVNGAAGEFLNRRDRSKTSSRKHRERIRIETGAKKSR